MANRVGYEKMERGGNVTTPFDLKFSKSGGSKTNTKLITNFLLRNLWKKKMNNLPGIFFLWWVYLTRGGWKSESER